MSLIPRNRCALCVLIGLVAAGCQRSDTAPPITMDDPAGPIVTTEDASPGGIQSTGSAKTFVSYFPNGYAKNATPDDRRVGRNEVRFYNPMNVRNQVTFEVYFENRPPRTFAEFTMEPNNNGVLYNIPSSNEEFFAGSEAWGARITSTAPLLVQNGFAGGVIAPGGDLWFGDTRYKGGYVSFQATRTLSTRWFFPDGLKLAWDEPAPGLRFQEYEWYHFLNPGTADANIEMRCYYQDGESQTFELTVKAERVRIVSNKELVRANVPHGIDIVSSTPILVSANRFIYDFNDTEDWGAWVHTGLDATPIEEIEADTK